MHPGSMTYVQGARWLALEEDYWALASWDARFLGSVEKLERGRWRLAHWPTTKAAAIYPSLLVASGAASRAGARMLLKECTNACIGALDPANNEGDQRGNETIGGNQKRRRRARRGAAG